MANVWLDIEIVYHRIPIRTGATVFNQTINFRSFVFNQVCIVLIDKDCVRKTVFVEDVFEKVYAVMAEVDPVKFPLLY